MTYFGVEGYGPRVTLAPIPQAEVQQYGEPDAQTTVAEFVQAEPPCELTALLPLFRYSGERRVRVLWLRFYGGLTLRAIGKDLGVSGSRARQLLEDALRNLRRAAQLPEQRARFLSTLPEALLEEIFDLGFRGRP